MMRSREKRPVRVDTVQFTPESMIALLSGLLPGLYISLFLNKS